MSAPKSVCVFCGHQPGADPAYLNAATELGYSLAKHSVDLIYGGGHMGMMGAVADGCLGESGRVIGIIPEFLTRMELAHEGLSEMVLVEDMDIRKHQMFSRSDAFIVLPGGFGTLDEAFEAVTLSQLDVHRKPLVIINTHGFFDPLRSMIEGIVTEGFAAPEHMHFFTFVSTVDEALLALGINGSIAAEQPPFP